MFVVFCAAVLPLLFYFTHSSFLFCLSLSFFFHKRAGELIAVRRVNFSYKSTSSTLSFEAPLMPGDYTYALYLMSDCYVGLDQQYEVKFKVTPAPEGGNSGVSGGEGGIGEEDEYLEEEDGYGDGGM